MASAYDKASLVMLPHATKDGKVYSVKPEDRSGDFTFSRGSDISATRVNSSGLIEKAKENLLLQSNTFDTTWTALNGASVTSGQTGYDGSSDAWLLDRSNFNAHINQTLSLSAVGTFSVYAKAGTLNWMRLRDNNGVGAYFDLSGSGAVGSTNGLIDASIESIGGGWFRCSVVANWSSGSFKIYQADANGDTSGTSGSIYIQDAQINYGLVAQDYVNTTTDEIVDPSDPKRDALARVEGLTADLPRLDYSGGASCPSLLLEPSRTNLITQSEYIGAWTTNGISLTANNSISPEGVQNAYLSTSDGLYNVHRFYELITFTSGTTYTFSIFAKADTNNFFQIYLGNPFDVSGGQVYANFDLSDGSKGTAGSNVDDYDIEDYGNGWYRCYLTAESQLTGTTAVFYNIVPNASAIRGLSSDVSGSVQFYGAGTEAGSYPTSYIPTYGAAATRLEDYCRLANASSLPTAYPFTMYVEAPIVSGAYGTYLSFLDISQPDDYYQLALDVSDKVLMRLRPNGAITSVLSSSTYTSGTIKIAAVFTASSAKLFVNGTAQGSTTSVPAFNSSINDMIIGQLRSVSDTNERMTNKKTIILNQALTDAEAIALTTL